MNEQALRQLLIDADAAAVAPMLRADLATTVRQRLHRRRQSQLAAMSLAFCALFAAALFLRVNPKPATVVDLSRTKAELSVIRMQADSQAATVNRFIQYQRSLDIREKVARKFDRGQPLDRLQQQRENAARLLTHDGEYRRVIELFPETHWASVARQRLQT